LEGYAERSVEGDDSSLVAFYRTECGQERGREGIHSTTMLDLQCVDFDVEGKPDIETSEAMGLAFWEEGATWWREDESAT
jgi:hypothetical protein